MKPKGSMERICGTPQWAEGKLHPYWPVGFLFFCCFFCCFFSSFPVLYLFFFFFFFFLFLIHNSTTTCVTQGEQELLTLRREFPDRSASKAAAACDFHHLFQKSFLGLWTHAPSNKLLRLLWTVPCRPSSTQWPCSGLWADRVSVWPTREASLRTNTSDCLKTVK